MSDWFAYYPKHVIFYFTKAGSHTFQMRTGVS